MPRLLRSLAALLALLLGACALPPLDAAQQARLASLLPADALLLGEQHDAPEHQQLQRQVVQWLADRGQLAAVVLEMAEAGHGTAGLPPDASARQVRAALAWDDARWPWRTYGPVIMAAVASFGGDFGWTYTQGAADYGVATIKKDKLVVNGPNGMGSFDLDRVNNLIKLAVPIYKAQGATPKEGVKAEDIVTNEFIDPNIKL